MYAIYTAVSLLLAAIVLPYFVYQAVRYRKYVGSLRQRLGRLPVAFNLDAEDSIWIHAVSVGEALTARALIPALRIHYPSLRVFLSTTTMTGQQVARAELQGVDGIFYFPFDVPGAVNRTLEIVRPRLFVMIETEIWPNLLRACRARGVRTALVNGRLSERSWRRYRLVRPLFRRVLGDIDLFCAQSEASAHRLRSLGAAADRVVVTGSLKFDSLEAAASPSFGRGPDRVLRYFRVPAERHVIVAASTLNGEETAALNAFRVVRRSYPDALLILAPRHPERFDLVSRLAREEGYRVARRTDLVLDTAPDADVVVLDTIGELARLYRIATVVFVGGSLVDAGGHNILEPAVFGKPVLFGPHMQNFAEIASAFLSSGAAIEVANDRALADAIVALFADPARRAGLGAAARTVVEANRGARDRTLEALAGILPPVWSGHDKVRPFRRVR